ncbi:long-chain fatty acid--CoA ligase [Bacillus sp. Soil745]|jgi:long-chain acyl-CoA synthetase|uniref:long-chain-fatty-acid--CoA ligase n=1 Tax=Peribacillus TaxID=2675229 RepID=UPI00070B0687|nr:long-chain-fatty-acid--CoA ligase [Peribacillus frigoritolerans]KRF54452.1 long-chain fatty acid--CoA ligase [Bacillus sp. Soil745]PAW27480.1 long-chain fatty acid--CoA ligase [Peribacillus simplex]MCY8937647.1 long-chain-fatty-acid--CoA ligase [Peribacillus frigoritolerans]MED3889177.1 long-chain-fatty-acid--CoA ligase [Peribacillus frigoritolerans]MED4634312.1 long-chain-fatty-acid--CoA ligase [Peribacillus frigoritolerans]
MSNKPWQAIYPEQIPAVLSYEDKPLYSFLKESAEEFPDKVSIHFQGKELTFREVHESALKFAAYLKSIGLQKGERVAVMLPNCPQGVISFFGILMAGGVVVQTNPTYTERELEYQMKDSGAKMILVMDILFPRVSAVASRTDIEHIIVTAIKEYLPFPKNLIYPFIQKKQYGIVINVEHEGNHHLFSEIMKRKITEEVDTVPIDVNNDLALLQYTGGTTGFPKGVMLTHKNLLANTKMCNAWLYKNKRGEERILAILPFFHVYGMTTVLVLSVMEGNTMIIMPKFDVEATLKTIQKQKPTMFPGAPTMYIGLLNHPDIAKYDLSSINACISGSASLPLEVQEQFEKITGGKLVEGYGLSETSPVTHANFIWDQPRVKGSVGLPWPDTDSAILSLESNEELPPNEIGEIAIKGPQVMKGYWNRPDETEKTFKNGWLLTGDLGYMDEQGFFYVVERKKDTIIAGGFNIYPREVEEVLYEHEAIQEVVVAGIPDPYRGETVKAYVVLKKNARVTEEELNEFARKNLASYKVPRSYEFRDELPKTTIGKILRRVLIEEEKKKISEERKEA